MDHYRLFGYYQEHPMALSPGTHLGPYQIVAPLGAGGMGEVYRARDARLGRDVALKILPPELAADPSRKARFDFEARAAGALNHPNLVAVYDIGSEGDVSYIVSELIEGESLRELSARGPVPPRKTVDIAIQIAEGLAAAHNGGLVHRDLKPDNVMIAGSTSALPSQAKILDFGLARQVSPVTAPHDSTLTEALTNPGMVLGTVGYMAPEQVRGQTVDQRADIFSLGVVIYEMLAGKRAFPGPSNIDVLHAILNQQPAELPPGISPALQRILWRCLEKEPSRRYQNASDLAFALRDSSEIATSSQPALAAAPRSRSLWTLLAAGLLLAATGVLVGVWSRRHPAAESPSYRQITFQEGSIDNARFTPDGQSVVYSAEWTGQTSRVYVAGLHNREVRALTFPERAQVAAVSSRGDLALLMGSDLLGNRALGRLVRSTLSGENARDLLPDVPCADWSPDGAEMAVIRFLGPGYQAEYPVGNVISRWQGRYGSPACRISPDGALLAFQHAGDLMIAERGAKNPRILRSPSLEGPLTWTPDGKEIWGYSNAGSQAISIHAVNLKGEERLVVRLPGFFIVTDISREGKALLMQHRSQSSVVALAPGAQSERTLSVSTDPWLITGISGDGRSLAVTEVAPAAATAYVFHTDGSPALRVTDGFSGQLSPDGSWMIVSRGDSPASERMFAVPVGAGVERPLTASGIGHLDVSWFSDSKRFLASGVDKGRRWRFFTGSVDADNLIPFDVSHPDLAGAGGMAVSPDGSSWIAQGSDRKWRVYPMGPGEAREVPGLESARSGHVHTWTPDGASIYMQGAEGDSATTYKVNVRTGERLKVHTVNRPGEGGYSLGFFITPDGRSYAYRYIQVYETLFLADNLK